MTNYTKMLDLYSSSSHIKHNLCNLPLHKKYRSHFEIIGLVLEAVKDKGTARFSIMKHADINCAQLKKYLQALIDIGFIQADIKEGRVAYRATEKGLDFLRQYYVLLGMLLSASTRNNPTSIVYETEYDTFDRQQRSIAQIVAHLRHAP
jgi:predicted transcriptional regulator